MTETMTTDDLGKAVARCAGASKRENSIVRKCLALTVKIGEMKEDGEWVSAETHVAELKELERKRKRAISVLNHCTSEVYRLKRIAKLGQNRTTGSPSSG